MKKKNKIYSRTYFFVFGTLFAVYFFVVFTTKMQTKSRMIDTFQHRIIFLINAGLALDELHSKYIEDRYKRTMLSLPVQERQEVCAHPELYYPKYQEKWDRDWKQKVTEAEKLIKQQKMEQLMASTLIRSRLKGTGIQFRVNHQDEKARLIFSLPKRREVCYTLTHPTTEIIQTIISQVIAHHQSGAPLDPTARITPRSIYAVWEKPE